MGMAHALKSVAAQRELEPRGDGPGQLQRLVEAAPSLATGVQGHGQNTVRQGVVLLAVMKLDGICQQVRHGSAVDQLIMVFESRDQAVDREAVKQGADHLGESGGLLLAIAAKLALGRQGQGTCATLTAQPG